MKPVASAIIVCMAAMFSITGACANADDSAIREWQMKRLMQPGKADLQREKQGHIMIYHGLRDSQVEQALSTNFHRMEAMMFTGTIVTDDSGQPAIDPDSGDVLTEDDGCD